MRVAIDARSLGERNTSNRTYWSELVTALGQRSDIELLLVSDSAIDPADIPPNGRAIVESAPSRWFSLVTLPRIVRQEGVHLVHVQYTVSPFFRTPVVTTIHDVSYFVDPSWFGLKDRLVLQRTVPAACRRAARVLAPSETCREEILAYVDVVPEKVAVTLEGTPHRLLSLVPDPSTVEALVGDHPYALLAGGASPRKNLVGAVKAVREARRTIPDLLLLVTGHLPIKPSEPWVFAPGPLAEPALAAAYRGGICLVASFAPRRFWADNLGGDGARMSGGGERPGFDPGDRGRGDEIVRSVERGGNGGGAGGVAEPGGAGGSGRAW